MTLLSQILIGCPSSGKSTVANELIKQNPKHRIVSTDKIREQLFGDESRQRDWQLIEAEVLLQITQHLDAGYPIIYDATNAQRAWRIDLLQKLKQYDNLHWIGWYLKTPLNVCQQWNQQRKRQVPEEVIEQMYNSLRQFPPITAEGFTKIVEVSYDKSKNTLKIPTLETIISSLFDNYSN